MLTILRIIGHKFSENINDAGIIGFHKHNKGIIEKLNGRMY